jgi:adenylate cyclase
LTDGSRRLAAIMFTDMAGYTTLSQKNEAYALQLLEEHRKLIRPFFSKHNGHEIKTIGDAFLVEFASALEAVRCAFDIHQLLNELNVNRPPEKRILLRIGVHLGDVVHSKNDVHGDAVNVASRIEPLASPGGISITEQVYHQVKNKFEFPFVSLGKQNLKNVQDPVEVYSAVLPWEPQISDESSREKRRIAVMPFTNISPDPRDEYLADGMTEELISTLSRIGELKVISRTSVMRYKGTGKNVGEIARELKVGSILEGSVRKASEDLRITAQLIDAGNDEHLWSQDYDRRLENIFAIQKEIAQRVAEALKVQLISSEKKEIAKRPTENTEAYKLYLKGRFLWNKRSKEGVLEALKLFQNAIKIDPNYAKAYSGLADAYNIAADYEFLDRDDALIKARDTVMKALELDDTLSEAHASLGVNLLENLKYHEARRELRRAIELNPNYATAHHWLSNCLGDLGNLYEANAEIEEAHELDPLSPIITAILAQKYVFIGKLDEALAILDKLVETESNFSIGYRDRSVVFAHKKMKENAFADWETKYKLDKDEGEYKLGLALLYGWFGENEKALPLIQTVLDTRDSEKYSPWFSMCYAALGEKDEWFAWTDIAITGKRFTLTYLRYSKFFDKVRNDPRFPEIFKRLGLPS